MLGILVQCDTNIDLKLCIRSVTYISWSSDFALYLLDYLVILNYLPISAFSGLLKFDMKMFKVIARLDIGQLFTQSMRRGASVYFVYISSFTHFFQCRGVLLLWHLIGQGSACLQQVQDGWAICCVCLFFISSILSFLF